MGTYGAYRLTDLCEEIGPIVPTPASEENLHRDPLVFLELSMPSCVVIDCQVLGVQYNLRGINCPFSSNVRAKKMLNRLDPSGSFWPDAF